MPIARYSLQIALVLTTSCVTQLTLAQAKDKADVPVRADAPESMPLVGLTIGGSLRLRADTLYNADLGNGTTGVRAPLTENGQNGSLSGAMHLLGGANARLRIEPRFDIGEWSTIHVQLDAFGQQVLGSAQMVTPGGPDAPVGFLDVGGGMRATGLGVRRTWAEFRPIDKVRLMVGRMGDHFGLGVLRNDGRDLDADAQTDMDRVAVQTRLFGHDLMIAWDSPLSIPSQSPGATAQGQAIDAQNTANMQQWVFQAGTRPAGFPGERPSTPRTTPGRDLNYALALTLRSQTLDVEAPANSGTCAWPQTRAQGGLAGAPFDCLTIAVRDASFTIPQAYVSLEGLTASGARWGLEAEAVAMIGSVGATDPRVGGEQGAAGSNTTKPSTASDILNLGLAARAWWARDRMEFRFDAGLATGDSTKGFGVLDRVTFADQGAAGAFGAHDVNLTAFRFHRAYRVDMLLFREVIGAVTNTIYARPEWRFKPGRVGGLESELRVGALYAHALASRATPGEAGPLGIEPDAHFSLRLSGKLDADLGLGLLVPLAAFKNLSDGRDPSLAFRALVRLSWLF